jgi:uncharacterized damage-inducible protein DinB
MRNGRNGLGWPPDRKEASPVTDPRIAHFQMLARYNRLANARLFGACAGLSEAELKGPRRAFFTSIHGTLNHLLVVDRLWFAGIEDEPHGIEGLDQILHEDFSALRKDREAEDEHMSGVVDGLDESALAREVAYRLISGADEESSPLHIILITLFNHQTHHRGQIHCLLTQSAIAPPPSQRESRQRPAGCPVHDTEVSIPIVTVWLLLVTPANVEYT